MMRIAVVPLVLMAAQTASAQTSAGQPDPAALQRSIDALNARLDNLAKENERLKRQRPTPAAAPKSAPSSPPRPSAQAVPGWFINLIPWTEELNGPSVAGFPGPMFDFDFDLHTRYLSDQNRYIYHGVSYFHPQEDGMYSFSITLEPVASPTLNDMDRFNCSGELLVQGVRILAGTTSFGELRSANKDIFRSQTFYGQTRLTPEPGKGFKIDFKTDCWYAQNRTYSYFDRILPAWKKNRFKIMVKTPADTTPRPFKPDELYYAGRPS